MVYAVRVYRPLQCLQVALEQLCCCALVERKKGKGKKMTLNNDNNNNDNNNNNNQKLNKKEPRGGLGFPGGSAGVFDCAELDLTDGLENTHNCQGIRYDLTSPGCPGGTSARQG